MRALGSVAIVFALSCADAGSGESPRSDSGAGGARDGDVGGEGGTPSGGRGGAQGMGGGNAGGLRGNGGSGGSVSGAGGAAASAGGTPGASGAGGQGAGGAATDPLSTDRGAFFGDSRCGALGVLFCDGFENGTIDTAAWEKQGGGTAVIDAAEKARGASSVHLHTDGNGFSFLRLTRIFPVASNRYYGRIFVRFDALPTAPIWAHWTIAEARGQGDGSLVRIGGQWNDQLNRFGVGSDGGPTGDWTNLDQDPNDTPLPAPEDDWACIEWLHDGENDRTELWWDAVLHPSLSTTASSHGGSSAPYVMPEFESVWVGWWLYQGSPTPPEYDVWIDEVAFDTDRIGCVR